MRLFSPKTWEVHRKKEIEQLSALIVLAESDTETISLDPESGLVLDEVRNGREVVSEHLFTVAEAKKHFEMFPTLARDMALRRLGGESK